MGERWSLVGLSSALALHGHHGERYAKFEAGGFHVGLGLDWAGMRGMGLG